MARAVLDNIGIALNVKTYCRDLSVGEQHLIEIAKGAAMESRIVIYDEPTAALDSHGVEKLMSLIDAQKKAGKLIFYISHRLDEIFRQCDTVTVLKDGRHVRTCATSELTRESLVSLMVGREVGQLYPARSTGTADGSPALSVRGLMVGPGEPKVSFALRRGEILGLAGLEGQGQRELARTIVGLMPSAGGTVHKLDRGGTEKPLLAHAVGVVNSGVGFVPEDRKTEGLYLTLPIRRNMGLGPLRGGALWSRARTEGARIQSLMQEMNIRARSDRQVVSALSGGNQQKVMIGRWLLADVDILVIEEPTRGVDVGAKAEIYRLLRDYASKGGAVLMTSSEMTEHLGLCDRILVVRSGAIVADLEAETATEEIVARHAFLGATAQDAHP
jgi:ribose transport system ATP-binding protein